MQTSEEAADTTEGEIISYMWRDRQSVRWKIDGVQHRKDRWLQMSERKESPGGGEGRRWRQKAGGEDPGGRR